MAKIKLTKNDFEKVLPPKEKQEAIEQSERYEKEYEKSKKQLDAILEQLERLMKELDKQEDN